MTDSTSNAQLIREFLSTLPSQIQNFNQQMLQDLQPKLESWMTSLNLVTTEQLEAQTKLLRRAQQDLLEIKKQLIILKNKSQKQNESSDSHSA